MVATLAPADRKPDPTRKAQGKTLSVSRKLNSREKRFCALIAAGWSARKAYQSATGCTVDQTADVQAWRWKARPVVDAEIQRQRAQLTEETAASRAEKRNHLARIMRADETPANVVVSAIAVDNRMTGDDDAGLQGRLSGGAGGRVTITLDLFAANGGGEAREDTAAGEINVTPKIP